MPGNNPLPMPRAWRLAGLLLVVVLSNRPAAAHTSLSGRVTDAAGDPIAGAFVYAYDSRHFIIYDTSEEDGSYDLAVLPGTWSMAALAPGYATATASGVTVALDTHTKAPGFKLASAPPFPIVKAARPISLAEGIDTPAFGDAPEIRIDQPYNVVLGLDSPNAWKGPQLVSGRFKVKWDATGLYYAGEVIWAAPGLNSHTDGDVRDGNAIELYLQTAPYDPDRTAYEPDQNWHLTLGAGPAPSWWLFGAVQARPTLDLSRQFAATPRPDGNGFFFRLDVPWSMLPRGGGQGAAPPAAESLGAIGIAIDAANSSSNPDHTVRKFQLSWPMSSTNDTNPRYLQPAIFTTRTP